jgi:hypothetical protein
MPVMTLPAARLLVLGVGRTLRRTCSYSDVRTPRGRPGDVIPGAGIVWHEDVSFRWVPRLGGQPRRRIWVDCDPERHTPLSAHPVRSNELGTYSSLA